MIPTFLHQRREIAGQLFRFLISGGLVTALGVGVYGLSALVFKLHPQVANLLAYGAAVSTGYLMHSRWSFRNHGRRSRITMVKFFVVSLVSLSLNSLWIAILTDLLGLSPAWPMVPMVCVTPIVTFLLNRYWVFR